MLEKRETEWIIRIYDFAKCCVVGVREHMSFSASPRTYGMATLGDNTMNQLALPPEFRS